MNEEEVLLALKALADSDRELEAPADLETKLRASYRAKMRLRSLKFRRAGTIAALSFAAIAAAIVLMIALRPRPVQAPVAIAEAPVVVRPSSVFPVEVVDATPPPRRVRARPREITTDFFPLVDLAPPLDRGALVRVNLPAAAMRTVGLPVREDRLADRVNADVLVSEEGVATAIRFVKYQ